MTGGIFMMSNFEGLFSPWRDLETEIDELRTMRRVSQMWREMESRDRGVWTMYGRFFDRQMDGMNSMGHGPFTGFPSTSHRIKREFTNGQNKSESNVIVEFPSEDREIKIELEEPLVEITEVIEPSEPEDDTTSLGSRNSSPVRKSSLVNGSGYTVQLSGSDNTVPSSNMSSVSEEHTIRSVDSNKTEKRNKRVDFSKMEVHFEPGSGRVNIVETNGKPPSNQLFRRKKRHREKYRSDSPKLNFVGSSEESYESINSHEITTSENIKFTELQNDFDLSIFNLRNSLFKNSELEFLNPNSKNILNRSPSPVKHNVKDSVLTTNHSSNRSTFHMSSKLHNMIKNSVIHHIHIDKSDLVKDDRSSPISLDSILSEKKYSRSASPGNTLKGNNNSLKRSNSRGKEKSSVIRDDLENTKPWEEKSAHKVRVPVIRGDSFKKNARVTRQESIKSNSSRGSNSEIKVHRKTSIPRSSNGRISRTPSIARTPSIGRTPSFSRITTSLKKGGIYVDASPKRPKGSTVTIINFSGANSKSDECNSKPSANNLNNSRSRIARKESFKSSRESLSFQSNRVCQKKTNELKDPLCSKQRPNVSSPSQEINQERKKLNFVGRSSGTNSRTSNTSKSPTVSKKDNFNCDVSNPRYTNLKPHSIKNIAVESVSNIRNTKQINQDTSKGAFHHEDKSLFQPIKKEKSIHTTEIGNNDIKTPIAIRKRISTKENGRETPSKNKITNDLTQVDDKKVERRSYTGVGSKLNFVSLKRAKEPLRSFEKISNGWVGRCNMVNIGNDESTIKTEWPTKKVADISLNTVRPGLNSIGSVSPVSQISTGSRTSYNRQRESMMRLSRGFSSRPENSLTSPTLSKNIDTRKRPARNIYTPSISPPSIPSVGKRKPAVSNRVSSNASVKSDASIPTTEPLYETLNSRKKGPTTSLSRVRRTRQTNTCCNI